VGKKCRKTNAALGLKVLYSAVEYIVRSIISFILFNYFGLE
jgi:hypothetical protein